MMVRIMAEENLKEEQRPEEIVQTIETVRDFLQKDLDSCKDWEEFSSLETKRTNFSKIKSEPAFRKLKGIGARTISKFLGGNWNTGKIQGALEKALEL